MPFRLYRSNRVEKLAEALVSVVQRPLSHVFARECIVVQGPGMERWLSAMLAERLGIWSNPHFPFPRAAIELVLDALLGRSEQVAARYLPDALSFRVARALPDLYGRPNFAEVGRYLGGDRSGERLLSFARRMATTFDQYLVYRPELVLSWEEGRGDHFQAELWRALLNGEREPHLARRMALLAQGTAAPAQPAELPERISLFGLSSLPPAFLRVLASAAQHCDVHMFVLSPSREYWGDLDASGKHRGDVQGLLADLGKTSRELLDLLLEADLMDEPLPELYEAPSAAHVLAGLQTDLLELNERGGRGLPPLPLLESDDSLRVHICHSRTRELEVLRDELRQRFERDPSLLPSDVVVFAPDIESYAPAIEAVFAPAGPHDKAPLPFRIADRKTQRASEVAASFLALLDLLGSRVPLSELLDLLHRPAVRARFGIEESELDSVQHWLVESGARWAIDAQHRQSFGQPGYAESSLQFAVDRLLLGYAHPDHECSTPYGVLPCPQVEGQAAVLLGRLSRFVETIARLTRSCLGARTVQDWAEVLRGALSDAVSDADERGFDHHLLRTQLSELAQCASDAGFEARVSLKAVRDLLEERLERARLSGGFLAGGITFCEHVPMRAIPFRVVCLLGMDDESFPRSAARASFDLIAETPRRGDRSVRDDDRQLFLEALLSARDALLMSYVGRSAQDDSLRPASALLEHLLRVVDRHFAPTASDQTMLLGFEGTASQLLSRQHALHAFDVRYFSPSQRDRLFSYDQRALAAARAQLRPRREPAPFVEGPLPYDLSPRELSLQGLERFFRHPQKRFLKERLSVVLPRDLDPICDREPTKLDVLERYQIGDDMLRELSQLSPEQRTRVLLQSGRLPPGTVGQVQLADIEALVEAVLSAEDAGPPLPDRDFEISLSRHTLVGRLDRLFASARVEHLVSTPRTKHKLSAWIRHLVLCASGESPRRTLLVGKNKDEAQVFELSDVPNARELLDELSALYQLGMHMPLPYFHEPAQKLLDRLDKGEPVESALAAATLAAMPAHAGGVPNDADDVHVRQTFSLRQLERLPALVASDGESTLTFQELAERILRPMQRHLRVRSS